MLGVRGGTSKVGVYTGLHDAMQLVQVAVAREHGLAVNELADDAAHRPQVRRRPIRRAHLPKAAIRRATSKRRTCIQVPWSFNAGGFCQQRRTVHNSEAYAGGS